MKHYKVPGLSVALINNNAIEWARGYGVLEVEGTRPISTETLFQAAPISKPVSAMAALHFVQEGKLSLDEDINAKLKAWKIPDNEYTKKEKVTLRRLLSHNAGLTVHGFPGYAADEPVPTLLNVLDRKSPANSSPISVDMTPGSKLRYSGGGYCVLQQLLVDVRSKPFPEIMEQTVLSELSMKHSTYRQPLPESKTTFFLLADGGPRVTFVKNENDQVTGMVFHVGNVESKAKKLR